MSYFPPASGEDPDSMDPFDDPRHTDPVDDELARLTDWARVDDWDVFDEGPDAFDLEHSELDRRLRNLVWPSPPADVRERCLQAVLRSGALACPPPPRVHPQPPSSRRKPLVVENVERHELTRRAPEALGLRTLAAPRRADRFGVRL